jgi:outer membrane protein insertion porin family
LTAARRTSAGSLVRRVALAAAVGVGCLLARPATARAQDITCDPGDTEVRSLHFEGNHAFSGSELALRIATTPSTWSRRVFRIFGARYCLDSLAFRTDSLRLIVLYRRRGYTDVRVGTRIERAGAHAVDITFRIAEGLPVRIAAFTITGLDSLEPHGLGDRLSRGLPVRERGPFDQDAVEAARDTLIRRLRNNGYPNAEVLRDFATNDSARTATVTFNVSAGPRARLGAITITVRPRARAKREVSDENVRDALGVKPGDLYRQSALEAAKRNLYTSDAFSQIDVATDSMSLRAPGDSTIDVHVTVTEGYLRSGRTSMGYGALDCFRTNGEYADVHFLGGIRRLELSGRLSKIGKGAPMDFAPDLCPYVRDDPYSDTLNYYVGATLRQPALFGLRSIPTITLFSERRSEYQAFARSTPIGLVASLTREPFSRLPVTYAYQLEFGRTQAEPALFCAVFGVCNTNDQEELLNRTRRLAVGSVTLNRNRSNDVVNPTRGSVSRIEFRLASKLLGSEPDLQFTKVQADGAWYLGGPFGAVLVGRLRAGAVLGQGLVSSEVDRFIPPQERLYAGGPSTVRGFRQNELGPAVYIPTGRHAYDTLTVGGETFFEANPDSTEGRVVPIGGNRAIVGNVELRSALIRTPVSGVYLQWALFADAGEVWNTGGDSLRINFRSVKVTPGAGIRLLTDFGPLRLDIGYNPYQLPAGAAYFNAPPTPSGAAPLYCVAPSNRLPVLIPADSTKPAVQAPGVCPPTFRPPRNSFFRRLTFNFSIGQAF